MRLSLLQSANDDGQNPPSVATAPARAGLTVTRTAANSDRAPQQPASAKTTTAPRQARRRPDRQSDHQRTRQPLLGDFLAIDVETTGFSVVHDRVIELGYAHFVDGAILNTHSSLIATDKVVPAHITDITGISDDILAGRPRFRHVAAGLVRAIERAQFVVAYNAPFDKRFVATELARAGLVLPNVPWVDALAVARGLDAHRGSFALTQMCERHNIDIEHAHHALDDAIATGELFLKLTAGASRRALMEYVPPRALKVQAPLAARLRERFMGLFR